MKQITISDVGTMPDMWEQLGHAGKHEGHHLHADDMQDVYCCECARFLSDEDAAEAWPEN